MSLTKRRSKMAKIGDIIEKLVTVTANFASLREQVLRIEHRVNNHAERITRLEGSRDVLVEQARSAAVTGVARLEANLIERIVKLEEYQKRLASTNEQRLSKKEE